MMLYVNHWKDIIMISPFTHYSDGTISVMASQIPGISTVCSNVYSDGHQRKDQSSASLAFMRGIHRWPVDSPHKGQITRKIFSFDDVIMTTPHMHESWKDTAVYCCTDTCDPQADLFLNSDGSKSVAWRLLLVPSSCYQIDGVMQKKLTVKPLI